MSNLHEEQDQGPGSSGGRSLVGESIGAYRVVREIARGGMGIVYEAVHGSLGQRAAVKVLSEELVDDPDYAVYVSRFLDEARAVTVIGHPGIVRIQDQGQLPSGTVYIMMEYLAGQSLHQRLWDHIARTDKGLPVLEVLRFARQIAAAAAAAHDKGILHRDLKLANVLVVTDPETPGGLRTKLIDFGLARFLDTPNRRTTAGALLGTPGYMSPEQCRGEDVDEKADVYALGVMIYEMLVGSQPFDGVVAAIIYAHISTEPPPLRGQRGDIPETVHHLCHSMLTKDPASRPTMAQVVSRIQQIEAELSKYSGEQVVVSGDETQMMKERLQPTPSVLRAVAPGLAPPAPRTPNGGKGAPQRGPTASPRGGALGRGQGAQVAEAPRSRIALYAAGGGGLALLLMLILWLASR